MHSEPLVTDRGGSGRCGTGRGKGGDAGDGREWVANLFFSKAGEGTGR